MAAKRGRKTELSESNLALLNNIKFATSIQKGSGLTERQTHCRIFNGYVCATNDVIIIGMPISGLSIDCCPHSKTLIAALERCHGDTTFTLDGSVLVVKSGRVRVPVPCIDYQALADLAPDNAQGAASPSLADALGVVAAVVDESDERLFCRPVYMSADIAQGTHKGHVVIQAYHGVKPLPDLSLPKESAIAVSKHVSKLTSLGLGVGSATFWFEDNSFIRTCLFDIKPPDFDRVLEQKIVAPPVAIIPELFDVLKTVLPFTKETLGGRDANCVTFEDGKVWAGLDTSHQNASYDFDKGPIDEFTLNATYLLMFETLAATMVLDKFNTQIHLYSDKIRGVIKGMNPRGQRG